MIKLVNYLLKFYLYFMQLKGIIGNKILTFLLNVGRFDYNFNSSQLTEF